MFWILLEISILVIAVGVVVLYRKTIRPLHIIGNGMDLLKEQDFSSRLGYVGQKDADKVVDIFNKMMEQLKNERLHLREQNRFLDLLIASSPVGVVILDFDEKVMQVNPSGYKILHPFAGGHSGGGELPDKPADLPLAEMIGHSLAEYLPLGPKLAALERGESQIIRLNDASVYKCSCSTFVESGFYHKFYLMEQMTQEVLKAEKKAYEKVIRTIAHEVNNSLAGIGSTLEMVTDTVASPRETTPGEGPVRGEGGRESVSDEENDALYEMLRIASERCSSLSGFITHYADVVKIPEPQRMPVSLNEFIRSRSRFLEMLCAGRAIRIRYCLTDSNPVVLMDPVLMEQVLVNIVKNSTESMGAGEIVISTFGNGGLEIADNGAGIPPDVADKLFTPFFSTKPNGQGIGLIFIREVLQKHTFLFRLSTGADGITRFFIGTT